MSAWKVRLRRDLIYLVGFWRAYTRNLCWHDANLLPFIFPIIHVVLNSVCYPISSSVIVSRVEFRIVELSMMATLVQNWTIHESNPDSLV